MILGRLRRGFHEESETLLMRVPHSGKPRGMLKSPVIGGCRQTPAGTSFRVACRELGGMTMRKIRAPRTEPWRAAELWDRLQPIAARLPAEPVVAAYLFGSYGRLLRGGPPPGPLSDIDVAVLLSGPGNSGEPVRSINVELYLHLLGILVDALKRDDVDLLVLNAASPVLRFAVLRDGMPFYVKDQGDRLAFEVAALRTYQDMEPLRGFWHQEILRRLKEESSVTSQDVVLRRIEKLREYLRFLRQRQHVTFAEYMANEELQAAVERRLQLALEAALDIGNMLIARAGLPQPDTYRDVILGLGKAGILPAEFAQRFSTAAGFRNVLVHDYMELDPQLVYRQLQNGLADLELFLGHVATFLGASDG